MILRSSKYFNLRFSQLSGPGGRIVGYSKHFRAPCAGIQRLGTVPDIGRDAAEKVPVWPGGGYKMGEDDPDPMAMSSPIVA